MTTHPLLSLKTAKYLVWNVVLMALMVYGWPYGHEWARNIVYFIIGLEFVVSVATSGESDRDSEFGRKIRKTRRDNGRLNERFFVVCESIFAITAAAFGSFLIAGMMLVTAALVNIRYDAVERKEADDDKAKVPSPV